MNPFIMTDEPSILAKIGAATMTCSAAMAGVGRWLVAHPLRSLAMSAEDVARQSSASLAAVNRFARHAGFDGFAHLKSTLADELQEAAEPIRKLDPASRGGKPRASAAFVASGENLALAAGAFDTATAAAVAKKLAAARMVYTLGLGLGHVVASSAAHLLLPYVKALTPVAGEGGSEVAARRLISAGRGDVVLAVSLPRYSRETVELARFARGRGAFVAAIVDRPSAPLAAHSNAILLAPASHPTLASSIVAAVAIVEELATRVMVLNPDAARIATELSDAVLGHFDGERR